MVNLSQSICEITVKWLFSFASGVRNCLLASKPHSWLIAGEGRMAGRVLDKCWQLSWMRPLTSWRPWSVQRYTVLGFGQGVGSACWKVYENQLSRRTAPENVHRACKFQCRKLPIKFGGRETIYIIASLKKKSTGLLVCIWKERNSFLEIFWNRWLLYGLGSIH